MKLIDFQEKNIYKILREYDFHNYQQPIAIRFQEEIPSSWIQQMLINEWYLKNPYIYVIENIDKKNISNLENITDIISGVIFKLSKIENYDYFSFLLDYCKENEFTIYFLTDKIDFPYNEKNDIIFGGNINEI